MNPDDPSFGEPAARTSIDPLGLADWSASHGLDRCHGLALASCFLSNCAAGAFGFGSDAASPDAAGLNLLHPSDDVGLRSATNELLAMVAPLHERLVAGAGRFTAKELDALWFDPRLARMTNKGKRLRDSFDVAAEGGMGAHDPFQPTEDLHLDRFHPEFECLTRPAFLLRDVFGKDLSADLSRCHTGFGFAVSAGTGLNQRPAARNRQITELLRLIHGTQCRPRRKVDLASEGHATVRLRILLSLARDPFDSVLGEVPELLESMIPLSQTVGDPDKAVRRPALTRIQFFHAQFRDAIRDMVSDRRSMETSCHQFRIPEFEELYLVRRAEFLRTIAGAGVMIGGAERLPATLCWTLLVLTRGSSQADSGKRESWALDLGFETARRLHSEAVGMVRLVRERELARQRSSIARKLHGFVKESGPCKRRVVMRRMDVQSKAVNEPVLQILISGGALAESSDGLLSVGSVPLSRIPPSSFLT